MKNSWKLGRVAGIDIYLHPTFLLVILWIGIASYFQGGGVPGALRGIFFILILFTLVVLHELGHSLAARRFGIRTQDITLWPIGGISSLERLPENPKQQLLVALAGPAVNIAIALVIGVILVAMYGTRGLDPIVSAHFWQGAFLQVLFWMNISLAVFNLLPAFPMDGGRVFRAILAFFMSPLRATKVAARVGQAMALIFGILGLLGNPILFLIAIFIWIGAVQESTLAQLQAALQGIPVHRVMIRKFYTLSPEDPLERAVTLVLAGFQHQFPVVSEGRLVGTLSLHDLLRGLAQHGTHTRVGDIMQTQVQTIDRNETLDKALLQLQQGLGRSLVVVNEGQVEGILTFENLMEFLGIQAAISEKAGMTTTNPFGNAPS